MKLNKLFILIIKFYQRYISPIKPKRIKCRFYPTCSRYAILAFEKHGTIKGLKMTLNRLKRCNPHNTESCIDYP